MSINRLLLTVSVLTLTCAANAATRKDEVPLATPEGITLQALGKAQGYDMGKQTASVLFREELAFTDAKGMTLYTYAKDEPGKSNCADDCAKSWVPLAAGSDAKPFGADEDPKAAFAETLASTQAALAAPGALERVVPGPMGEMPLEQLIGRLICSDILVHTWDLARAAGLDESLDAVAVTQSFKGLQPLDAMIRRPGVFGPKVEAPAGADEQTQFLSFLGRQV